MIIADGGMHFYQWDTGKQLAIINEKGCGEVHFCHNGDEKALVCPVREAEGMGVVDVPNILLQREGVLMAYMTAETETGSQTQHVNSFCVKARPKPEDYIYTETEVLNYTSLSNRLEKLEGEGISQAVEGYLKEHPVEAGATAAEAAQIAQNTQDIKNLSQNKLDASALPKALGDALAQAKASGDFKGDPGDDYVLTEADKKEIAELTAPLVDVPEGGGGSSGAVWHRVGEQKMDGVETAVSFDLNGETIIQVVVTAAWMKALTATKATVSLTYEDGGSEQFYAQTLNSTQFAPKNVFLIFGDSRKCRQMIFMKSEGATYAPSAPSSGASYGYDGNDALNTTKEEKVTAITITFDVAPSEHTVVMVGGM